MKTLVGFAVLLGLVNAYGGQDNLGQVVIKVDATPKDLVQKLLDDQVVAWNKGDLDGFMAGYWKSPELSFFSGGTKTAGWQATIDRYKKKYQGQGKEMGKLAFKEISIDNIGADHAYVRGRWHLTLTKESVGGLFTLVMKKMPEGWRIVHDHTSN